MMIVLHRHSLLSSSTSFTPSDCVESLLDILARSRGITHLALQVEKTRAWVSWNLSFDALATKASHILLNILLVKSIDHGTLMATLKKDICLGAKVALHIHFCLNVLEQMDRLTVELLADHIEVDDWGLGRHELGLGQLTLLVLRLFLLLFNLLVHDGLNTVE